MNRLLLFFSLFLSLKAEIVLLFRLSPFSKEKKIYMKILSDKKKTTTTNTYRENNIEQARVKSMMFFFSILV